MKPLNPTAQKVQDILIGLGTNSQVVEFTESTRTAQEAADRVGCQLGQIVKSMIFKGQASNKGILVLTSGSNRVDEKSIRQYAGESITRADAEFVRSVTGFAIGGVPPVGHAQALETYIDRRLIAIRESLGSRRDAECGLRTAIRRSGQDHRVEKLCGSNPDRAYEQSLLPPPSRPSRSKHKLRSNSWEEAMKNSRFYLSLIFALVLVTWLDRLRKIRFSLRRAHACRHPAARGFTAHP